MTLRQQLELRKRQWEAFNRWEEQQPTIQRDPASVLSHIIIYI
jgi:hypothetical protein